MGSNKAPYCHTEGCERTPFTIKQLQLNYLALNFCLPIVTTDEQIVTILSGESARLTRNSLVNKERFLFKQAETFCSLLAQVVKSATAERQRLIFVTLFKFTPLTKKICSTIVKGHGNIICGNIYK